MTMVKRTKRLETWYKLFVFQPSSQPQTTDNSQLITNVHTNHLLLLVNPTSFPFCSASQCYKKKTGHTNLIKFEQLTCDCMMHKQLY